VRIIDLTEHTVNSYCETTVDRQRWIVCDGVMTAPTALDSFLATLDALEEGAARNAQRSRDIQHRIAAYRRQIERGRDLTAITADEPRPRLVELLTANKETLETTGAQVRATQARALRAEGRTLDEIGAFFGVTRQRISALLQQRTAGSRHR